MDLRTEYPRSMRVKLAGYIHVARMIDKARSKTAGTLGEYIYPCPMDDRFLEFTGLNADEFQAVASTRPDEAVAAWVRERAKPHSQAEIDQWNEMMLARGPATDEKRAYFNQMRDSIDPSRTDITAWANLLDLDEKRPVPKRTGG
ncbi:MAG: DUF5069 domain-containing protein [Nitrospira sp.]|nr:DUF5069 domain-containing protein [Nitrospira sp.]